MPYTDRNYWRLFDPEYPEGIENLPPVNRDEHRNIILKGQSSAQRDSVPQMAGRSEVSSTQNRVGGGRNISDETQGTRPDDDSADYILRVRVVSVAPGEVDVPGLLARRVNAALDDMDAKGIPGFRVELGSYDVTSAGDYKNMPLAMISYWTKKPAEHTKENG